MKESISNYTFEKIVDLIIRLGIIFLLVGWCLDIIGPFILILIWATVIAIAIHPMFNKLRKWFRGNRLFPTLVLTIIFLGILLVPSIFVGKSLTAGVHELREIYEQGKPLIPPPGDRTANWPGFAKPIADLWKLASTNLEAAATKYSTQLQSAGLWIISALAGIGKGVLQFMASIIIAGVMLFFSDTIIVGIRKLFKKIAGEKGDYFANMTVSVVRNVVKGILGVAIIQTAMAGLGFFIAGVPYAGLWTIFCLVLAIIQVGVGPIAIPIAIYMFSVADTTTATILAIWLAITLVSDNVLKPILLGRNAPAPMLVIFLGAIGGFIYNGFLGLFLGAVILCIGYQLLVTWMNSDEEPVVAPAE
jgi:predicted PurR-regulated permease PerM